VSTTDTRPDVPNWPKVSATVRTDGTAEVTVDGTSYAIQGDTVEQARAAVLQHVSTRTAAPLGRPVKVETVDPEGQWNLIVHPDGHVDSLDDNQPTPSTGRPQVTSEQPTPAESKPATPAPAATPPPATPAVAPNTVAPNTPSPPAAAPKPAPDAPAAAAPTLTDLLATRPPAPTGPAQNGWQGAIRRISGGLVSPAPSARELAHREAIASVQRSLRGPKTVVVVNPKGGAHKTTATLLIASTFGIHRGGYTLAWDNNETRGTLGWRANPARHTNTAVDLLRDLDRFTDVRSARVGDLDNYVRSQGSAQFDVLASDEDAASAASIDAAAFDQLHRALSRFYRVLVVDTGNNMRASNWQAAIDAADQLVIVSTIREDTAASAAWLADALSAAGRQDAVQNAVTVLSAPARTADPQLHQRLHDHFGKLTRTVLDVPHDPALISGGPITYDALSPSSRTAWLQVTAAIADGL
jgi:MinD-like ATPase involved in chromosome partitioning or flagellar assembly